MARKPRDIPLNRRPPRDESGYDWDPTRPLREQWPWNGEARIALDPPGDDPLGGPDDRITEAIADLGSDHEPPAGYEDRVLAEVTDDDISQAVCDLADRDKP